MRQVREEALEPEALAFLGDFSSDANETDSLSLLVAHYEPRANGHSVELV